MGRASLGPSRRHHHPAHHLELALGAVAEAVLAEDGSCPRCDGHTLTEDRRTDLDVVLSHYETTSSSPDLPCTAGDGDDRGFSLYTETIHGSGPAPQHVNGAAVRVLEEDTDEPVNAPLAYVLDAAGLAVSVCVRDGHPQVHVANEHWPDNTRLTLTVDSHPSEQHRAPQVHRLG